MPGLGGGGWSRELVFNGERVSVSQDEKILDMDDNEGCTMI